MRSAVLFPYLLLFAVNDASLASAAGSTFISSDISFANFVSVYAVSSRIPRASGECLFLGAPTGNFNFLFQGATTTGPVLPPTNLDAESTKLL